MNQAIRNKLHQKFLQEFSNLIKYMTDEKSKDIELRILRTFTSAIVENKNSILFDEIEKDSEKLIEKLTYNISHNDGRFVYLIERFSRDIFDILISSPLFTQDRKDKFKKASVEFSYLDKYYNKGDGSLVRIVLTGKNNNYKNDLLALGKTLISWSSNLYTFQNKATDVLRIGENIVNMATQNTHFNIDKILEDRHKSKTESGVLLEINNDIANLKDILKNAVTPAINLETAFLNGVDKQIKILIDSCQSTNTENSQIFNDFISKIVPKVKSEELNNINQKLENYKLQKEILKEIKDF